MLKISRLTLELIFLCDGVRNVRQIVEIMQSIKPPSGLAENEIKTFVYKKIESFLNDGIAQII
ncbi:hypothetical protein CVT91_01575 [Candidatus Atribacteria bacterium HGW-Atribacteria-1]|nr:MAG: hypothetical protein CVT91_01575 [Candidatus Atribacteria bacterium HGW-Atribacteria-1]